MLILNSGVMAEVLSVLDELVWEEEDKEKFPILKLRKIWDSHSGRVKKERHTGPPVAWANSWGSRKVCLNYDSGCDFFSSFAIESL